MNIISKIERLILENNLGNKINNIEKVTGGLSHRMYKVETDKAIYAVKELNAGVMKREKAYSNFVFSEKVTDIAKENGISAIGALKLNNDIMLKIEDSYFMVFEWLEGRILQTEEIKDKHCEIIGKMLAKIHNIDFSSIDDDRKEEAIQKANERWNKVHSHYDRSQIKYDDWLELFERAIKNCQTPIIDLGCGSGNDTLYLIERGKKVIPCDYSQNAIQNIQKNFPEIERAECFDMSKGLPFEDGFTDIIISDLSLHYFTEAKTFEILEEIKRVLKPNGILLFRVNSVRDVNYGAGEGTEIEPHLYETEDGRYKRFFDNEDFKKFFANWEELYLHEETMGRYELEKVLWRGAFKVNK